MASDWVFDQTSGTTRAKNSMNPLHRRQGFGEVLSFWIAIDLYREVLVEICTVSNVFTPLQYFFLNGTTFKLNLGDTTEQIYRFASALGMRCVSSR